MSQNPFLPDPESQCKYSPLKNGYDSDQSGYDSGQYFWKFGPFMEMDYQAELVLWNILTINCLCTVYCENTMHIVQVVLKLHAFKQK